MFLNKAIIVGNLTRDPEKRAMPSGNAVTSFSLATNRVWKDKDGNKQESSDFHNIVVFGRQAENCAQYLKKGQNAMVEGRIQTRSWEKDGQKQYRTEIVADRVQFGPKAGGGSTSSPQAVSSTGQQAPAPMEIDTIEYPEEQSNPEDIPF